MLKLLALACAAFCLTTDARAQRPSRAADSRLTGVYRINTEKSDRLYSVVSNASSNPPYGWKIYSERDIRVVR